MRCDTQGKKINELNGKIYKWWAREDSNLQPSGYERPTLSGKINKNRHFCARSIAFVHVWLRCSIGHLLVGPASSPWRTSGHQGSLERALPGDSGLAFPRQGVKKAGNAIREKFGQKFMAYK